MFTSSFCFSQINLDDVTRLLNQVNADDVNKVIERVIKKKSVSQLTWSGIPGDPSFNIADRIAITDLIYAYGFYWDTNQLDFFLSLFTEDAQGISFDNNWNKLNINIKTAQEKEKLKKRMNYFIKNNHQRRHIMSNTHFTRQTFDYAEVTQYMLLISTNEKTKAELISPVVYNFKFKKIEGIWKISFRQINLDKALDLDISKSS